MTYAKQINNENFITKDGEYVTVINVLNPSIPKQYENIHLRCGVHKKEVDRVRSIAISHSHDYKWLKQFQQHLVDIHHPVGFTYGIKYSFKNILLFNGKWCIKKSWLDTEMTWYQDSAELCILLKNKLIDSGYNLKKYPPNVIRRKKGSEVKKYEIVAKNLVKGEDGVYYVINNHRNLNVKIPVKSLENGIELIKQLDKKNWDKSFIQEIKSKYNTKQDKIKDTKKIPKKTTPQDLIKFHAKKYQIKYDEFKELLLMIGLQQFERLNFIPEYDGD